ncbi:hypothetical protein O7635_21455 [Asanoa sp. WMMD1127]|uniref:hypothetical protein n=1 Tax=Asanoa sp. WMMD1127 TaxID=3016107 RepID=UPI002415E6A2|nr:hypothetical protein [Asanoa sp. WMMD1127]MDG4824426.1 hypothetical protein [Asanoa sp. WMMD1127]
MAARRVRTRLPTLAAVVASIAIATAMFLVFIIAFGAAEIFEPWVLVVGALLGVTAGAGFFVVWRLRDLKRRRRSR